MVFANTAGLPERASRPGGGVTGTEVAAGPATGISSPGPGDLVGWRPALWGPAGAEGFFGEVRAGTLYVAMAPGGDFQLSVAGIDARAAPAFTWATQFRVPASGPGALRFAGWPFAGIGGIVEILVWLVVLWVLIDRRFVLRARLRALAAARPSETILRPPAATEGPRRRSGASPAGGNGAMSGRREGFFNDDTPFADEPPPPRPVAAAGQRPVRPAALAAPDPGRWPQGWPTAASTGAPSARRRCSRWRPSHRRPSSPPPGTAPAARRPPRP